MQLEKLLDEQTFQLENLMIKLDEKLQYLLSNITPAQVDTIPNIEFSVSFNSLPSLGLENGRLIREVELQSTIQEILIPQFEQAKLEESKQEGGIKRGDIIIQFDGKPVSSTKYFQKMVTNAEIGRIVSLKVFRDGKEKLLKIKVGKLVS